VTERVVNIKMAFLWQWRVGVRLSEEGGRRWWSKFNASILAREGRRRDEALSEDEAEAVSSS
jgi:hypothetical protein